jgi:superfamily II DNA helicase RecQ
MSFISAQGTCSWTVKDVRDLVQQKFSRHPCWFQVKVALALNAGKDVVGCAATGAGKTLSFWIPLLMVLEEGKDKMIFVVTPLNLLGKQNVQELERAGISAIAVTSKNANTGTFKVRIILSHQSQLYILFRISKTGNIRLLLSIQRSSCLPMT